MYGCNHACAVETNSGQHGSGQAAPLQPTHLDCNVHPVQLSKIYDSIAAGAQLNQIAILVGGELQEGGEDASGRQER
jgi:hypothetical protein